MIAQRTLARNIVKIQIGALFGECRRRVDPCAGIRGEVIADVQVMHAIGRDHESDFTDARQFALQRSSN
jgi:hypothetical protein